MRLFPVARSASADGISNTCGRNHGSIIGIVQCRSDDVPERRDQRFFDGTSTTAVPQLRLSSTGVCTSSRYRRRVDTGSLLTYPVRICAKNGYHVQHEGV